MVIEWLTVRVPLADQTRYIATDRAIWSGALARHAGYLGKEIWSRADDPEALNILIRWQSRAAWKAVPADVLAETETAFVAAMGRAYPIIDCVDMDVR
jgi:uncharacterized protein (TIGR03792 family)